MKTFRPGRLISPSGFLVLALLFSLAYLTADAAGWRQYTSVLSGTPSGPGGVYGPDAWRGGVYIVLYFAFVLLVPILVIAAVLFFVLQRRVRRLW